MRERLICWQSFGVGIVVLICPMMAAVPASGHVNEQRPERFVFDLDEVSAFELNRQIGFSFSSGQRSYCTEIPSDEVEVYPEFKSDKPFYGSVEFRSDYDGALPLRKYYFVLDESAGTGGGYDRLHFDMNQDLDLTNDSVLSPHKNPPNKTRARMSTAQQQTTFEYLNIPFEFDSESVRPLKILPWFLICDHLPPLVKFVNPTIHKSKIELAGHRYDVYLGHDYMITGWFHSPLTAVYLIPEGKTYRTSWRGAERLMAVHNIAGTFYQLSATPAGDKLIAQEYNGPFGTFEVRPGRDIRPGMITAGGSLRSQEIAVALGGPESRVPVGNYLPSYLTIIFVDRMMISLSDNYHADGQPGSAVNRKKNYAIKIRQDKPYILDFSNKPEVMFASPAKDHRLKPGDELAVKAVLVDPGLDVMIRDLKSKVRSDSADGGRERSGKYISLDPKVVITRANGEKLAEGVMPFG